MNKIINLDGTLIELEKVKAILINEEGYFDIKLKSKFIKIILQNRKEYIFNPIINDFELIDISDEFLIEFPTDGDALRKFYKMQETWNESLI